MANVIDSSSEGRKGFACKQFFVAHDKCAMKVSTDSLLLGSFTDAGNACRVLDVGTGSGILALMMAQKSVSDCHIDAVDIDDDAVQQARENVALSPWPHKISVQPGALEALLPAAPYDVIITNPPYFHQAENATRAYQSMTALRGQARNESGLSMAVLFARCAELTTQAGRLNCMYPYSRYQEVLMSAAQSGWYAKRELVVCHNSSTAPYICLFEFTRQAAETDSQQLWIRHADNQYTEAFKRLCRAFYRNF
ncbi:tRNA1(Val) (adenine(37)-N6)-methyltransferase [Alteromonas gilva]|uniref:tRNA1(Val) (adenine(37)-N6)-methyltransferase n=1 Tax=Alteromonas gilva TaxID=2987522 RepID=A0ABT5L5F3_9ALTE|nr:methyltransferase [Alteromonas gilva]MDC8832276.1 methyltransferase [Alteromonas gilva]